MKKTILFLLILMFLSGFVFGQVPHPYTSKVPQFDRSQFHFAKHSKIPWGADMKTIMNLEENDQATFFIDSYNSMLKYGYRFSYTVRNEFPSLGDDGMYFLGYSTVDFEIRYFFEDDKLIGVKYNFNWPFLYDEAFERLWVAIYRMMGGNDALTGYAEDGRDMRYVLYDGLVDLTIKYKGEISLVLKAE